MSTARSFSSDVSAEDLFSLSMMAAAARRARACSARLPIATGENSVSRREYRGLAVAGFLPLRAVFTAIFGMSHHLLYIDHLGLEVELNHQPETVPADVKYCAFSNGVGMRVDRLHFCTVQPHYLTRDLVPGFQRFQRFRVLFGEVAERSAADHVSMPCPVTIKLDARSAKPGTGALAPVGRHLAAGRGETGGNPAARNPGPCYPGGYAGGHPAIVRDGQIDRQTASA